MKIEVYVCDKCKKEFREPLVCIKIEPMFFIGYNKAWYYIDICNDCFKEIKEETGITFKIKHKLHKQ
jgi:DNA-directed RNA polymerase subunit RPC12/RpoP